MYRSGCAEGDIKERYMESERGRGREENRDREREIDGARAIYAREKSGLIIDYDHMIKNVNYV